MTHVIKKNHYINGLNRIFAPFFHLVYQFIANDIHHNITYHFQDKQNKEIHQSLSDEKNVYQRFRVIIHGLSYICMWLGIRIYFSIFIQNCRILTDLLLINLKMK